MRKHLRFTFVGAVFTAMVLTAPAFAESRTVTLSVPAMDCPVCPITVKQALQRVDGVERVAVTLEPKEAVVTFDDTKTTVDALRAATTNAGYPSTVKTVE